MCYHDHGHAFLSQLFHQVQNLADHLRIQRGCGLIEEDHIRVHGKGPDDRHPLFLPAGQRGRINVRLIIQADPLQQLHCLLFCLAFDLFLRRRDRDQFLFIAPEFILKADHAVFPLCFLQILAAQIGRSHHDVLQDRLIIEQVEVLEYHSHVTAVDIDIHLHVRDVNALEDNASGRRVLHTVEAPQEGTLTGAGRSEHCDDIAFIDGDVDPFEDIKTTEAFLKINYVYHSSSGSFPVI